MAKIMCMWGKSPPQGVGQVAPCLTQGYRAPVRGAPCPKQGGALPHVFLNNMDKFDLRFGNIMNMRNIDAKYHNKRKCYNTRG